MKKPNRLKRILILLLILLTSAFVGLNTTMAIPIEQTNWDVVYNSGNANHPGSIYNGATWNGSVSLATKSDGYPAIAFSKGSQALGFSQCTSDDCAAGDGVGNWDTYTDIDTASQSGYVAMDFDANDNPVIAYNKLFGLNIARYVGSGGNCGGGSWTCNGYFSTHTQSYPDLVIDSNNKHFLAYDDGSTNLVVAACNNYSGTLCDASGDYTLVTIDNTTPSNTYGISMDIDPSGFLHLSYGYGNEVKYTKCDTATGCDNISEWSTKYSIATDAASPTNTRIDASTGTLAVAYYNPSSSYLKYAEYVGSGGNCTSNQWNCSNVTTSPIDLFGNGVGAYAFSMDISDTGERGIAIGAYGGSPNMRYVSCASNCTTNSSWTSVEPIFVDDGSPSIYSGRLISMEFGSGPRIAASANDTSLGGSWYVYYAEQESDTPPEEQIVPELPQSGIWKIAIAVLAFGLVIGIVAWRNKKKK